MEHSAKFDLVKGYYDAGKWSKKAVRNAVGSRRKSMRKSSEIHTPPEYQLDNYLYKLEREGRIVIRRDQLEELADDFIRPPFLVVPEETPEEEL